MNVALIERLRKVLALTASPVEGEAAAAAAILQKLLTEHNLSMADIEKKGGTATPEMLEQGHDLGKAAFQWKLDLADAIAEHFFCIRIESWRKTVKFVGRPDNVESLLMLYSWLIDQIKRISAETRREHQKKTGEHIDPLRWQVSFGVGAVRRLSDRLREIKERRERDEAAGAENALVVLRTSEVNDYLERTRGYRHDDKPTKKEQERRQQEERIAADKAALLARDPDEFYRRFPDEHPDRVAERKAARDKENAEWWEKEKRNEKRRKGRAWKPETMEQLQKREQSERAETSGRANADRINLQPFISSNSGAREIKNG